MCNMMPTLLAFLLWLPLVPHDAAPPLPVRVVTVYHAVPEQTSGNPRVTADGTWLDDDTIANGRVCAVSQELLWFRGGPLRYGDWLWVDVPDPTLTGYWQVHDTMWAGAVGYVDLLVPQGVIGCWRTQGATVRNPRFCPVGAEVYMGEPE